MNQITEPWRSLIYYRKRLREPYSHCYDLLYDGIRSWQKEIELPYALKKEEIKFLSCLLIDDHPLLFNYARKWTLNQKSDKAIFKPYYAYSPADYEPLYEKVLEFVSRCSDGLKGKSDFYIVRAIHDTICMHVIYGETAAEGAHDILGTIIKRSSVCEGIAKSFKLICDSLGVASIVVDGWTKPEDVSRKTHSWNCVNINGVWYNMDVTWDLKSKTIPNSSIPEYRYFCRSDSSMARNHFPSCVKPACQKDMNLYKLTGRYAETEEQLKHLLVKLLAQGGKEYHIEYSENLDPTAIIERPPRSLRKTLNQYSVWYKTNVNQIVFIQNKQQGAQI